jgi:hypothetical protein
VRRRYKIAAGVARNSESHESATDSARPYCVVPETTARAAMEPNARRRVIPQSSGASLMLRCAQVSGAMADSLLFEVVPDRTPKVRGGAQVK